MADLILKTAKRSAVKLKLALSGPSGGGKTFSALLMAKGLVTDPSKIAVIDTENGSAALYDRLAPGFQHLILTAPFSPERYVDAIKLCDKAGIELVIIDSISHEWDGPGGCLEVADQLGKFQGWATITPRHRRFLNAILQCPMHVIATMRSKSDYDVSKSDSGKTTVTKVGLKQIQREGVEFEFTTHFALNPRTNIATIEKDRTGLFPADQPFIITEETGKLLHTWSAGN